jgi:hypothetical protein
MIIMKKQFFIVCSIEDMVKTSSMHRRIVIRGGFSFHLVILNCQRCLGGNSSLWTGRRLFARSRSLRDNAFCFSALALARRRRLVCLRRHLPVLEEKSNWVFIFQKNTLILVFFCRGDWTRIKKNCTFAPLKTQV